MPDIEYFETKKITCGTGDQPTEYTILLQNDNGPCPLVALVNTLILSDQKVQQKDGSVLSLASFTNGRDKVSVKGLLEQLGELLMQNMVSYEGDNNNNNADNVLGLLPKLVSGLNINVRFNGTFEDTPEMSLFRIYDVDIVHGWICDPDDPEYKLISQVDSYDEAVSAMLRDSEESAQQEGEDRAELHAKAAAVKHFMDTNATQLTNYGLGQLRALLEPESPAVLFRNDHFATIMLRNNCLYTLVADQGYKDQPRVVWQSLVSTSGNDDMFFDGKFNTHDATEQDEPQETFGVGYNVADENADYALARELQMSADSEMAQELATANNQSQPESGGRRSQQPREGRQQRRGQQQQRGRGQEPKKKEKKCTIM